MDYCFKWNHQAYRSIKLLTYFIEFDELLSSRKTILVLTLFTNNLKLFNYFLHKKTSRDNEIEKVGNYGKGGVELGESLVC